MAWPAVGRVAIMIITWRGGHTEPPGKESGRGAGRKVDK